MNEKYRVIYAVSKVEKHFEKFLGKVAKKQRGMILDAILNLAHDPRPRKTLGLALPIPIYDFVAHYRLRVGDYRVLYDVDDSQRKVFLLDIRKRNEHTYLH